MSSSADYFANHRLKMRFPWRLYHAPIVQAVARTIGQAPGGDILNIGSGPFFEFEQLPKDHRRYVICDIDERAISLARVRLGSALHGAQVVPLDGALPFASSSFDVVFSTEVIEHVPAPDGWVAEALRVLRPCGTLLLTTPNYQSWSLSLLERTVLEAIARAQGFTRANLHPSRFDARSLRAVLSNAGASGIDVRTLSLGWVLLATAQRRP
jgi:SAM-dependent methyltransferase